jgi:hypothetical protein
LLVGGRSCSRLLLAEASSWSRWQAKHMRLNVPTGSRWRVQTPWTVRGQAAPRHLLEAVTASMGKGDGAAVPESWWSWSRMARWTWLVPSAEAMVPGSSCCGQGSDRFGRGAAGLPAVTELGVAGVAAVTVVTAVSGNSLMSGCEPKFLETGVTACHLLQRR